LNEEETPKGRAHRKHPTFQQTANPVWDPGAKPLAGLKNRATAFKVSQLFSENPQKQSEKVLNSLAGQNVWGEISGASIRFVSCKPQ